MVPEHTDTSKRLRSQGAEVLESGVRYRTWCSHASVSVLVVDENKNPLRTVALQAEAGGYFSGIDEQGAAGDLYMYRFGESQGWPDPASRCQPQGVHGPSLVIDPRAFSWSDASFVPPPHGDLVIYELHVGTFTSEGTFRGAIAKLDHIADLGANVIELMPIGDFPGERNWGYDGVALHAPARTYGPPDDLRALVDAAHVRGLAVMLDVVYNHMGPDGNYLGVYHSGYFNSKHKTPWGAGLHFEDAAVREFFAENVTYWMREFHVDGFRLDATHAICDFSECHVLAEISKRVHAEGGFLIAEDERNEPELLRDRDGGGLGFDGVWSDDFHHVVRVLLTKEREGYYENFHGRPAELAETLQHGWLFRGQRQRVDGQSRGGESIDLAPEQFIYCISNHDQVGNRAFGERLGHVIEPAAYRAASALLCMVPYTPMLFMGQEWAASTPFLFFIDHKADLGKLITEGRRKEFQNFAAFRDPELLKRVRDPQERESFERSKLRWQEADKAPHQPVLQLYREFLALRKTHPAFRARARGDWEVRELNDGIVMLHFGLRGAAQAVVLIDLIGGHAMPDLAAVSGAEWCNCKSLLSSNEARYGGTDAAPFCEPTTLVLELAP